MALQEGHLALVRAAQADCDRVVVSIFANPKQFAPIEHLACYPRRETADLDVLRTAASVDLALTPEANEIYPARFCDDRPDNRAERGSARRTSPGSLRRRRDGGYKAADPIPS
jgi:pantothenate synthetase